MNDNDIDIDPRIGRELSAIADEARPRPELWGRVQHRVRVRRRLRASIAVGAAAAVAAVGVGVAIAVGGSPTADHTVLVQPTVPARSTTLPTTTTTTNPESPVVTVPSTTVVDPAQALAAFLPTQTGVVVHSGPIAYGRGYVAFVGLDHGPHDRAIVVVSITNGTASPVATLALPFPYFDFALDHPIQSGDVTGDGLPDALVRFVAADNLPGVVVSADGGGTWRLLAQNPDPTSVYLGDDPTIAGDAVHGMRNDCTPDCAQGHLSPVTWQYDRRQGQLHLAPA